MKTTRRAALKAMGAAIVAAICPTSSRSSPSISINGGGETPQGLPVFAMLATKQTKRWELSVSGGHGGQLVTEVTWMGEEDVDYGNPAYRLVYHRIERRTSWGIPLVYTCELFNGVWFEY